MGGGHYDEHARSIRSASLGYATKSIGEIFTQTKERRIHESMAPTKALLREARDSGDHPLSVPIIMALDLTGSMLEIPKHLIAEGLPKIMSGIIQKGVLDPQILFLGIGDHECDNAPLQVGQFESADPELDLWLTRTWPEGGGGSNSGESYLLAWYFASQHTVTDSWEKRKQKGLLFTIGDEPCLPSLPASAIEEIMGVRPQSGYTAKELLELAQETYDVFHIHVLEGCGGERSLGYWKNLLGQNCVEAKNHREIPKIITEIVTSRVLNSTLYEPQVKPVIIETSENIVSDYKPETGKKDEEML